MAMCIKCLAQGPNILMQQGFEIQTRLCIADMLFEGGRAGICICIVLEISSLLSNNQPGFRCECVMDNLIS